MNFFALEEAFFLLWKFRWLFLQLSIPPLLVNTSTKYIFSTWSYKNVFLVVLQECNWKFNLTYINSNWLPFPFFIDRKMYLQKKKGQTSMFKFNRFHLLHINMFSLLVRTICQFEAAKFSSASISVNKIMIEYHCVIASTALKHMVVQCN